MPSSSAHDCAHVPQGQDQINPILHERHSRKCKICRHPKREAIEADFIEWRHPSNIGETYNVGYDVLYRHARATGLLELRRENVAIVVQKVLEEVEYVKTPSAFAILRAVRTLACLNGRGQWTEPPTTHVVVNAPAVRAESANPVNMSSAPAPSTKATIVSDASAASPIISSIEEPAPSKYRNSNRNAYEKLELGVNDSKQKVEVVSNRNKT